MDINKVKQGKAPDGILGTGVIQGRISRKYSSATQCSAKTLSHSTPEKEGENKML